MKTPTLEVRESPGRGRGVFARIAFRAGDVIERCPVLLFPAAHWTVLQVTRLYDYVFNWPFAKDASALAFGFGSLYNHAKGKARNARVELSDEPLAEGGPQMTVYATRPIRPGDEILLDYGYNPLNH